MKNNDVETVQDLLNIRQEVLQLRSANNALEFQIQQKDELIEQMTLEAKKWKSSANQVSEDKYI